MRFALLPEPGPQRVYGLATLVNTFGFGLVVTSLVLYFTRVVHLGSLQVGLGLTISGLIGLVAGVPVGALADRTWVLLTEAPEGGWGLWGHAHTNAELVGAARAQLAELAANGSPS